MLPSPQLQVVAVDAGRRRLGAGGSAPRKTAWHFEVGAGVIAASRVEASGALAVKLRHLQQAGRSAALAGLALSQLDLRTALRLQLDLVERGRTHLRDESALMYMVSERGGWVLVFFWFWVECGTCFGTSRLLWVFMSAPVGVLDLLKVVRRRRMPGAAASRRTPRPPHLASSRWPSSNQSTARPLQPPPYTSTHIPHKSLRNSSHASSGLADEVP